MCTLLCKLWYCNFSRNFKWICFLSTFFPSSNYRQSHNSLSVFDENVKIALTKQTGWYFKVSPSVLNKKSQKSKRNFFAQNMCCENHPRDFFSELNIFTARSGSCSLELIELSEEIMFQLWKLTFLVVEHFQKKSQRKLRLWWHYYGVVKFDHRGNAVHSIH